MFLRGLRAAALGSILCLFVALPIRAASPDPAPVAVKPAGFAVSQPVRDLPEARPNPKETRPAIWERENEMSPKPRSDHGDADGALQSLAAAPNVMPPPIVSFEGGSNQDNLVAFGFRLSPPDTNGAVGPNHYVQSFNLLARVFDKLGAPLTPFFKLSSLFAPLGGICSTTDDGDPVAIYDALADRWILSQFGFASITTPPFHECVAISQTADPTGSYFLYDFITPGSNFPDYPKLSVWPDGYYMTVHQFLAPALNFNGSGVYAFERAKMIVGDPTASMIYFNLDLTSHPEGIFGLLPSNLDGLTTPAVGTPATVMYPTANEFGDPGDALRIFDFHSDFTVPASSTFTERPESPLAVAAWDPRDSGTRRDVEQPPPAGASNAVDAIAGQLMFRLPTRVISGNLSYTANVTVNVGGMTPTNAATFQAGIRWINLIRNSGTGVFSIADEGTYAPTAPNPATGENRWMGSIAQDNQGNIALGFSLSSTTLFPSIHYAGRLAGDPPGLLSQGEATLIDGTGVQLSTSNRWGDYSAITVDPADDCTFWYTQEYYTLAGQMLSTVGWQTRIGSFKYAGCTAAPKGTLSGTITRCSSGLPIAGAVVTVTGGYVRVTDALGQYSMDLPPGSYTASVTGPVGFDPVSGPVTITNGNTTIFNACLTGVPIIVSAGATLISESCAPANGVIDPGETVTVSFCVQNTGGADTAALMGTLEATGGVTNPSGPDDYGVVAAGGLPVCRDFTFTASPVLNCGDDLTATIDFQDGATGLGSVAYTFTLGVLNTAFTENFDGVTAPALPPGWTTSFTNGDGDCTVGGPLCTLGSNWTTVSSVSDTAPNSAFHNDPSCVTDNLLDSPSIPITSSVAVLTFRNSYNLENTFDGGVLEVSVGGGPFQDILTAGGTFATGGYNATISGAFLSPIAGRQAWSGNSNGFLTTTVNLPAGFAGQSVVFRWRMASDCSVSAVGWWVDTIQVDDGFVCCTVAPPVATPAALAVDAHNGTGTLSNLNNFLEPGESNVVIEPAWHNPSASPLALTGTASNLTGPGGALYTIDDDKADYGTIAPGTTNNCFDATGNCYQMSVANPGPRPAPHWDATFDELLSDGGAKNWTLHIGNSFTDVPTTNPFYAGVETIFHNGITAGCNGPTDPPAFCPTDGVTRAQIAVFVLKGVHGAGFVPPVCTPPGIFSDVPCPGGFAVDFIEAFSNEGYTAGCNGPTDPPAFCPNDVVPREQVAVFLVKGRHGTSFVPPACTPPGIFSDVPCPGGFAVDFIEQAFNDAITAGCNAPTDPPAFCPTNPTTREQAAVLLTKTFFLLAYGP